MLPAILALVLLVAALPAFAETDPGSDSAGAPTEIVLGDVSPPPPPAPDDFRVQAVERFLAKRQDGSLARSVDRAAKLEAMAPKEATAEELYGPAGSRLIAFDFMPEAIESERAGRFRIPVYLLFADATGEVVESRDESLDFSEANGAWACVSRRTTAAMTWSSDGVLDEAKSLGVSEELGKAEKHLRDWTAGRKDGLAYSVADIGKDAGGRVVVKCLRFSAEVGRRGFEVKSDPLVLSREQGVLRIESN